MLIPRVYVFSHGKKILAEDPPFFSVNGMRFGDCATKASFVFFISSWCWTLTRIGHGQQLAWDWLGKSPAGHSCCNLV
jgi:hypothetical protein